MKKQDGTKHYHSITNIHGNTNGGMTTGEGIQILWKTDGDGTTVNEVLKVVISRAAFTKVNQKAIDLLEEALKAL